jgi:hypothetical protein
MISNQNRNTRMGVVRPLSAERAMTKVTITSGAVLVAALLAGTAQANPVMSSAGNAINADPLQVEAGYRQELAQLRLATTRQARADGGTLTAAHAAGFQRRLDRINDFHRRMLVNNNPLAVGADGGAVSPKQLPVDWTNSRLIRVGANS